MRILIVSDLHADNYSQFSRLTKFGINCRLQDCLDSIGNLKELAEQTEASCIFFLGDLFNSRTSISIDVYYLVFREIEKLAKDIDIYLLVGNHDQFLRKGDIYSTYPLSSICQVISEPTVLNLDDSKFVCLPFREDHKELLRFIEAHEGDYLFAHLGLSGAKVGPTEYKVKEALNPEDIKPEKFKWVILGHYHKFQRLGDNIVYVGSMLQHNFGERDEDKFALILDTKTERLQRVRLEGPRFLQITPNELDERVNGNYVKIICKEKEREEVLRKLSALRPKGYVVEAEAETRFERRIEIHPQMSILEMIKKYVEYSNTSLNKQRLIKVAEEIIGEHTARGV